MVMTNQSQPKNYVLLGPPGSGKGTQAAILKAKYHLVDIEIGKELRHLAELDTELGRTIHEIIYVKKELVPDGMIDNVIAQVLKTVPDSFGVLLDGAPRKFSQIKEVEHAFSLYNRTVDKIIFLDISEGVAIERISTRFQCQSCKSPYVGSQTEIERIGKCTFCEGVISQRIDDTSEGVSKRYEVFNTETRPVIEHYREQGKLVHIDAALTPDDISHHIEEAL
jgi:adenylate kinase